MKKIYISLLGLITSAYLLAQPYNFSVHQGNYANLTNSISLNNGQTWFSPTYNFPIGFTFNLFDTAIDQLTVRGGDGPGVLYTSNANTGFEYVIAFELSNILDRGFDLNLNMTTSNSMSPISYKTEGSIGNRIFKYELNNIGYFVDMEIDNQSRDFINYQVWLHENSGDIEIHFGPSYVSDTTVVRPGAYIFLLNKFDLVTETRRENALWLQGTALNPTVLWSKNEPTSAITQYVPNGTIYRFSRNNSISLKENEKESLVIYPNPASEFIAIETTQPVSNLLIQQMDGQLVKEVHSNFKKIDLSGFAAGTYLVKTIFTNEEQTVNKLFVQ